MSRNLSLEEALELSDGGAVTAQEYKEEQERLAEEQRLSDEWMESYYNRLMELEDLDRNDPFGYEKDEPVDDYPGDESDWMYHPGDYDY